MFKLISTLRLPLKAEVYPQICGMLFSPLPQAGEGPGVRVIARETALADALTPTLSRLRERELDTAGTCS